MSDDVYRVEVIHYLNPHMIWVEVLNPPNAKDEYMFEQVGLYGILPLEQTLDVELEELKILKCDRWAPAATKVLKDIFNSSIEVWFSPTYIDRRTSIFDDNIHKYGELLIKHDDGKLKNVSKLLIKTNLAYFDVNEFHRKLCCGNLKTKLSSIKTEEIVKEIEKHYTKNDPKIKSDKEKAVKKQTSVFQISQEFESLLTVSNVERHNNEMLSKVLEQKTRDFELCKEVEEESIGCGFTFKSVAEENAYKQRQAANRSESSCKYEKTFDDIKTFINTNSKIKYCTDSEVSEQDSTQSALNTLLKKRKILFTLNNEVELSDNDLDQMNKSESDKMENIQNSSNDSSNIDETSKIDNQETDKSARKKKYSWHKDNEVSFDKNGADTSENSTPNEDEMKRSIKRLKPRPSKKNKYMMQVAIGPPGLHPIKHKIKFKEYYYDNTEAEPKEMELDKNKLFNNSNSDLDIDITDKKILIEYITQINRDTIENKYNMEVKKEVQEVFANKFTDKGFAVSKITKFLDNISNDTDSSSSHTLNKKSVDSDTNESDEDIDEIFKRINARYKSKSTDNKEKKSEQVPIEEVLVKYNVNPFKNFDADISKFVDKLVSPVLLVHLKINRRVQPVQNLRDVCFNKHIHEVLNNMSIKSPMMIQTVSWPIILRGYSLFMVSPPNSGKTMGYLPAVCRLVSDSSPIVDSSGPKAIIVCATVKLVSNVERMAKMFLGLEDRVLACYSGVDDLYVTTTLLNGCDLLIATPCYLSKLLLISGYGVDLRRLSIFVLDDCERLFSVYEDEIKVFQIKIKKMLKKRTHDELKVQFILASRVWCNDMEAMALKAPDSVVCIGAFQECVLYSKTDMSVSFIKNDKVQCLIDFLHNIDRTKKTVIVCESDDEVDMLKNVLQSSEQIVYATNNKMTVHDLYNLSVSWSECSLPLLGPILICCDGNLSHMNITDAHTLIHFSLPHLYSMFCKRFSVLNDNYPSTFKSDKDCVKIKIFVEESNATQLPKIINFIKRCADVPDALDGVCEDILKEKDVVKAKNFVPICDRLLMLGECPDLFYCNERHTILKDYDMPLEWLPTEGFVNFKVLHYNSAISYSGRLLSNTLDGNVVKYLQTCSALSLKMGMYYCKEINRKLHGYPKVGDICAVCIKVNLYVRCQVVKILSKYEKGNPNNVLIKLIDEEWYEVTRDINLYHLPEEFKAIKTYVAQIKLTNIAPRDNDITFSDLAKNQIKKIIDSEEDLFLRGRIALIIGNCIFVDTLEVCQQLTSLNEVVVKYNIKHELLKNQAILNEDLLPCLKKICVQSGIPVSGMLEPVCNISEENTRQEKETKIISNNLESSFNSVEKNFEENHDFRKIDRFPDFKDRSFKTHDNLKKQSIEESQIEKINDNNKESTQSVTQKSFTKVATNRSLGKWAILENDDLNCVSIGSSKTPEQFFIRLLDFESSMTNLLNDIDKYAANVNSNEVILREGEIVLAKFPDDFTYERARIEEINGDYVKCFFLDQGDWIDISRNHLLPITEEIINQIPFQAIECKLLGVRAPNNGWIDSTNKWFYNYCYEDDNGKLKMLYAKYFTKETAEFTGGFKYGVILFDTSSEKDVLINQLMIDLKLAEENADEVRYFKNDQQNAINSEILNESCDELKINDNIVDLPSTSQCLPQKLITTVPLVNSDVDEDDWDVNMDSDVMKNIASWMKFPQDSTLTDKTCNKEAENCGVTNSISSPTTKQASKLLPVNQKPTEIIPIRKPKLLWRQNKNVVIITILVDVDQYHIEINDKSLKFSTEWNNAKYEFDIELYGVIDKAKSSHVKKGLVILVKLEKYIKKNWLALISSKENIKNWISYDVSTLDVSSDEEDTCHTKDFENYVRRTHEEDSESEGDELEDDLHR